MSISLWNTNIWFVFQLGYNEKVLYDVVLMSADHMFIDGWANTYSFSYRRQILTFQPTPSVLTFNNPKQLGLTRKPILHQGKGILGLYRGWKPIQLFTQARGELICSRSELMQQRSPFKLFRLLYHEQQRGLFWYFSHSFLDIFLLKFVGSLMCC